MNSVQKSHSPLGIGLGFLWGVTLGFVLSNYPVPGVGASIGALLVLPMIFVIIIVSLRAADRILLARHVAPPSIAYVLFVSYALISGLVAGNRGFADFAQPLITLPMLPIFTYLFFRQFTVRLPFYIGLLGVLIIGATITVYIGVAVERRGFGLTPGANTTAAALSIALILVIWHIERFKHILIRSVLIISVMLIMVAIFYTASRTGYILVGSIVLMMLFVSKVSRRIAIALAAGMLLIYNFLGDSAYQIERFKSVVEIATEQESDRPGAKNVLRRVDGIRTGLDVSSENLWIGSGLGGSKEIIEAHSEFEMGAHNLYVLLIVDTGVIGLVLFSFFIVMIIRLIILSHNAGCPRTKLFYGIGLPDFGATGAWLLLGLVTLLIFGMTTILIFNKLIWVWFCIIAAEIALGMNGGYNDSRNKIKPRLRHSRSRMRAVS